MASVVDGMAVLTVGGEGFEDVVHEDGMGVPADDDCEEFEILGDEEQSPETQKFDEIVGALEEIILDPEFEETQRTFGMENCEHFEETDENKLVYTELFSKYTAMLEKIMLERLAAAVEGFDMVEFSNMLEARKDELDGDVFDMLMTLNDFDSFKELMLSYKAEMENGPASPSMGITVAPMHIYGEEQEDGEERPDLDLCLGVTGMGK